MLLLTNTNEGLIFLVVIMYLGMHIPAFIMGGIALYLRKKKPKTARVLFILTGLYFLIGAGICGGMFMGG